MATYNNIKKIKIGDNIFNLYDSGNSGGTITSVKTTAGAHTAVNVTSGAVSFNVPTKTSHLTNDSGFTTNTGTVTKVTAGTGLSIGTTAGGNFTTSGTINHTNSVTAQTTQALYPIKIDAQGHISAYGSAITSLPASDVSDWAKAASKPSYTASEVGAVPTTRTVNGKALSANVADADYITEEGNKAVGSITWTYRRTNKGDTDAWATVSWSSAATSVWSSPVRYKDLTISIPSGIFSAAPRITATSTSTQYWVAGVTVSSATSATIRFATVATSNFAFQAYVYAFGS